VLLLLDAPPGIELGIDNLSWKIGSKFKGIKMIPLGTHIIAYSLAS
jgi:A1 cistron-splicing factor AAR2